MERLSGWYERVLDGLMLVACLLLLGMAVMIGADVVSRNVGAGGVAVSNELSEDILYLMTLLAAPWLLRQGQHIRVDIVLRALPTRVAWMLEWVGDIVGLLCCCLLRLVRDPDHGGELFGRLDRHQDIDHAGMVDTGAAAGRLCPARHRIHLPHAPACRGRNRLARRRGFRGVKPVSHQRSGA